MCAPLRLTSQVPRKHATQPLTLPFDRPQERLQPLDLCNRTLPLIASHASSGYTAHVSASAPLKTSFTDLPVLFVPFSSWWRAVYFFAHRAPLRPSSYLFSIFRRRLEVAILREAGVVLRCAHALELLLGREARAVVGGVGARLIVREQEER